jgi:hypothetical protein
MGHRRHCDVVVVPIRHRRRRRRGGATAAVIRQTQRVGGVSGLINPVIQIPINLGDATAIRGGRGNSVTNLL